MENKHCPDASKGTCTPSQILPPTVIPIKLSTNLQVRNSSRLRWADIAHICPKQLPWARGLPPLQSATGSAASPSAIRDPAKQYVRSKSRAAQRRGGDQRRRGPGETQERRSPSKTWGLGQAERVGVRTPGGRANGPLPGPPAAQKGKHPTTSGRRRPRPEAPAPPAPASASPSPPGRARAPSAFGSHAKPPGT